MTHYRQLAIVALLLFWANDCTSQSQNARQSFPLERDHIFVWVSPGAPEAATLESLGLYTDGKVHKHVGQGTASKVFVFDNAYLELIWIDEPEVAKGKTEAMNTSIVDRAGWRKTGASPFGVGLHRTAEEIVLPFPTKKYRADWMRPDTFIDIAESATDVKEPFFFVVPAYLKAPTIEQVRKISDSQPDLLKMFAHALGVHRLTGVKVTSKSRGFSKTALLISRNGLVSLKPGNTDFAQLVFDQGAQGKFLDLRPTLPLVLKY